MIKFISSDDVLNIRNIVLRESRLTLDECRFPGDELPDSFHLGCFVDDELVCIASFHPKPYPDYAGTGCQLRGMATLHTHQRKGYGDELVRFAINYLRQKDVDHLWCNARKIAVPFYEKLGMHIVSDVFDVPGIGPHYAMFINLKQTDRS